MGLKLGDIAPDFTVNTTKGTIRFHEWMENHGKWTLFFSHPADFTPVCTTELGQASKMREDFEKRDVKLIGLSIDSLNHHYLWIQDINSLYDCDLQFPMISDEDRSISRLYGMLDQISHDPTNVDGQKEPVTVRSVFIIDSKKRIRLIITYPGNICLLRKIIDNISS
jgi:alkyl hydroperoxide reductase subunit AhpC